MKVAVLISGNGTNLQALIDGCNDGTIDARISLVISNKSDAYGLERARKAGIKTLHISNKDYNSRLEFDMAIDAALQENDIDFVCLAGFMRLLTKEFVEKWLGKMVNIHPSLLPDFKGATAQKDALEAGAKTTGCTVHYVVPEMDAGPVIAQIEIPITDDDTLASLAAKSLVQEHKCYKTAMSMIACGKIGWLNPTTIKGEPIIEAIDTANKDNIV